MEATHQRELFVENRRKRKRKAAKNIVPNDAPLVVSFSGGRTSAYMLWRLLQVKRPDWVLFANTGREREETFRFIHEVEVRWEVPIVWLEYTRVNDQHSWRQVSYETAHRREKPNRPFDEYLRWAKVLPNVQGRGCTAELKVRTMKRYLASRGITMFRSAIGIRADEADRAIEIKATAPSFIRVEFPLIEWGVAEQDVMEFWKQQLFDLDIEQWEGNCDGCYLKAIWKLIESERNEPGLLDWWSEWEVAKKSELVKTGYAGSGGRFRDDRSFALVKYLANHPQLPVVRDDELGCSNCMAGGWRDAEEGAA